MQENNSVFDNEAINNRLQQLQASGYVMGIDPYRRGYQVEDSTVAIISVHEDGSRTVRHYPIVPEGMQRQLPENTLDAIRPYQAFYNQVMCQLESVLAAQSAGASNNEQVNTLTEMAERTRREMEQSIGISRERQGRTREYPMTPEEAFAPINPPSQEPITRERIEQVMGDLFYGRQSQPRRETRIFMTEEGMRQYQEALRNFEQDFERSLWYGNSEPRKTRRDKSKPMKDDSPYWGYQTFD